MTTIRLTLEYDGSAYAGWQRQPNGLSVQELVEDALAQIYRQPVTLISSGRTDAGVHALGMVAHFTAPRELPLSACREGVNTHLPADIVVTTAAVAADDFHARYSAVGKWYRYSIWQGEVRSPLRGRRAWHLRSPLDLEAMRTAAASLVGEHDFAAFRSSGCDAKTTRREIFAMRLVEEGELLQVDVAGSGFLRNMVRVIVGTLVEIGQGKRPVDSVTELLQSGDRTAAGVTAPPQGLCLMRVYYPEDATDLGNLFLSAEKP